MIENVFEKAIWINLRRDQPPPMRRKIARMNAPPPIDEVMFSENENEKDNFSELGAVDEQSELFIKSYLYGGGGDTSKEINESLQ